MTAGASAPASGSAGNSCSGDFFSESPPRTGTGFFVERFICRIVKCRYEFSRCDTSSRFPMHWLTRPVGGSFAFFPEGPCACANSPISSGCPSPRCPVISRSSGRPVSSIANVAESGCITQSLPATAPSSQDWPRLFPPRLKNGQFLTVTHRRQQSGSPGGPNPAALSRTGFPPI